MKTQSYLQQLQLWPPKGRHILAQFDDDSIYVYQAYRPSIAQYAVANQRFGGEFSYKRMSWIKPGFLWMMYRSGWARKEGQERSLMVRLSRLFFDELLRSAVQSTYDSSKWATRERWQEAVSNSDVRLQWDPDHDPLGRSVERRALQLGLRGELLRRYGTDELLAVEDITEFVASQREHAQNEFESLVIPEERVYRPEPLAAQTVGLDTVF